MNSKEEVITRLKNISIKNIKQIQLRKIGLLDVFGKLIIDVSYLDDSKESIEIISPVPTDIITNWLEINNLLNITTLYEF